MKHLFLAVAAIALLSSCGEVYVKGDGPVVSQQKQVGAFSSIEIAAPVNAEITVQPGAPSVSLSGYENLLKHIRVSVKGNELLIEVADGVDLETDKPITAAIAVPQLNHIALSGAVEAKVNGVMRADKVGCDLSGSTRLSIAAVEAGKLEVDISGLGGIVRGQRKGGVRFL